MICHFLERRKREENNMLYANSFFFDFCRSLTCSYCNVEQVYVYIFCLYVLIGIPCNKICILPVNISFGHNFAIGKSSRIVVP